MQKNFDLAKSCWGERSLNYFIVRLFFNSDKTNGIKKIDVFSHVHIFVRNSLTSVKKVKLGSGR